MAATGREFENKISKKINKINKIGKGFFIKSPTPMKMININGKITPIYSNKALCDFVGIYNKKFILIEAKNISTKRFEFNRLKEHQEKQLSSIRFQGGISFIIFNIDQMNKIIIVDIEDYLIYKTQSNKKSININMLYSLGRDILLDELEEIIDLKSS